MSGYECKAMGKGRKVIARGTVIATDPTSAAESFLRSVATLGGIECIQTTALANVREAKPMTRRDIEREFTVQGGQIASKGKFTGEPVFAPYFWDLAMHGEADEQSDEYEYTFKINADQRRLFPELGKAREITLVEFDNGNVATTTRE